MNHQYIFLAILTPMLVGYWLKFRWDKLLVTYLFCVSCILNIIQPFDLTESSFLYMAITTVLLMWGITYKIRKTYSVVIAIILTLCLISNAATIMTYSFPSFTDYHYALVKTFTYNFVIFTSYVNIAVLAFIDDRIPTTTTRTIKRFSRFMVHTFGRNDSLEVSS